jgi:hypothetical protein
MAISYSGGGAPTTYLQIDNASKRLYIYSKEPREGFVEHTNSKGNVSYRQYVNNVSGKIVRAYLVDGNYGQVFNLTLEDDGQRYVIQFPVTDSAFYALARSIKNIDVTKEVKFSLYESKSNDKSYQAVLITYPNEKDSEGKEVKVEWGEELPKATYNEKLKKWNFDDLQTEALTRAEDFIKENNLNAQQPQNTEQSKPAASEPENTKTESKSVIDEDEDDGDLPF